MGHSNRHSQERIDFDDQENRFLIENFISLGTETSAEEHKGGRDTLFCEL